MRNIDIHADDFGYSLNASKDILHCIGEGKLNSFSIMGNMLAFEDSMEMLYKKIPDLPFLPLMSVHLNIPEGVFESRILPMSWEKLFISSYWFGRRKVKEEIKKEIKAQINKTQSAIEKCIRIAEENHVHYEQKGIRLDSHIHTHLVPVVWDALTELIDEEEYKIEYIRNPKEPLIPFVRESSLWSTYSLINLIKNRILMFYSNKVDKYCDEHKIDKMYMWGLMMSGKMDFDRISRLYPHMLKTAEKKYRKLELLFHPGQSLEEELDEDKGKKYFCSFNISENRKTEKEVVMRISEILDRGEI